MSCQQFYSHASCVLTSTLRSYCVLVNDTTEHPNWGLNPGPLNSGPDALPPGYHAPPLIMKFIHQENMSVQ